MDTKQLKESVMRALSQLLAEIKESQGYEPTSVTGAGAILDAAIKYHAKCYALSIAQDMEGK